MSYSVIFKTRYRDSRNTYRGGILEIHGILDREMVGIFQRLHKLHIHRGTAPIFVLATIVYIVCCVLCVVCCVLRIVQPGRARTRTRTRTTRSSSVLEEFKNESTTSTYSSEMAPETAGRLPIGYYYNRIQQFNPFSALCFFAPAALLHFDLICNMQGSLFCQEDRVCTATATSSDRSGNAYHDARDAL
jgi:hypothetical protein